MSLSMICLLRSVMLAGAALGSATADAQLRGHGGSIRALAVSADGLMVLSGSFDASAIRWSLHRNLGEQVLHLHEGAVNAVAILSDGRSATAGEDAIIGIWSPGNSVPDAILRGHEGPIAALAVSPDGATLASASWDRTVRLWPLAGGPPVVLQGHQQNVNGVAFLADSTAAVSASYDATARIWPLQQPASPMVAELPAPLNPVVAAPDGEIAVAGADGHVYFLSSPGQRLGATEALPAPIVALAISRDGARIAAAGINGAVAVIDRKTRNVLRTLAGPNMPVWAVAFLPDGRTLLTGGGDRAIRRWDTETGEPLDPAESAPGDPLAAYASEPGAHVFRGCVACHTLSPDQGNRAGPSLHGIFGRRIASLPGYNYSEALKHLDIVWTPETLAKLFEIGPARYTPGTKMPEQRIGSPQDRDALVEFLERATR
ncbi:MAG TPA: c-type cytochrome [Stellaceae bacterium]|nr:c-type cytochrome [Stellaceae bacterium]